MDFLLVDLDEKVMGALFGSHLIIQIEELTCAIESGMVGCWT